MQNYKIRGSQPGVPGSMDRIPQPSSNTGIIYGVLPYVSEYVQSR